MRIKIFLTGTLMMFSMLTFSQITNGKVSYDVFISSDDPNISAYVDQMDNSLLEIFFSGNSTRSNFYMGEMMTTMAISSKDQDTALVLLDGMMGKIAMKITENDLDNERRIAIENQEVELIGNETKDVMGYTCKKAIISDADGNKSIVWYTEKIIPTHRKVEYLNEDIPGLPLEMTARFGNMDMKIVAFEFKDKIKKEREVFNFEIPKG